MKHLGDITKICGAEIEPVDVIIGGSPCQDLSVAGKRAGLDGERSGLFMEQLRIIKEMRDATNSRSTGLIQPRYMVWENVPGAFSSNKGEDFRVVLEETAKIADETAAIPQPPKGKWANSGAIMGDGWSIAWRVFDAQFWGVPQRRRRIALVADFGGQSAPEILFEREGVRGDIAESGAERERVAGDAEKGVTTAGGSDVTSTLFAAYGTKWNGNSGALTGDHFVLDDACGNHVVPTTSDRGQAVFAEPVTYPGDGITSKQNASKGTPGVCHTLNQDVKELDTYSFQRLDELKESQVASTQSARQYKSPTDLVAAVGCRNFNETGETFGTLQAKPNGGQSLNYSGAVRSAQSVRRLTPLECERLQGFPSTKELKIGEMTKDEYIAWNIAEGNIIVNCENGKIFATRGPGGVKLDKPKELSGSIVNGYRVVSIRNKDVKLQCRVHRIVWIAAHGIIPDGYVIDHINNDKLDNRICNLQMLTPGQNSTKAKEDGLYLCGDKNPATKLSELDKTLITLCYAVSDTTIRELAKIFGVSKSRVHQIIHERGWTDIPPQAEVTAEDLIFWRTVWDEWDDMNGKKRHTDKQIVKWLKSEAADSARYKALGNSIALPPWRFVLYRIRAQGAVTMGSLFDGISGFVLIWAESGGQTLWASEIEPFCIAVTKHHFTATR